MFEHVSLGIHAKKIYRKFVNICTLFYQKMTILNLIIKFRKLLKKY